MNTPVNLCGCGGITKATYHTINGEHWMTETCNAGHSTSGRSLFVQRDYPQDLTAADLQSFEVDFSLEIENNVVSFALTREIGPNECAYVECSMPVLACDQYIYCNRSGRSPEYETEVRIDSWDAVKDTLVTVFSASNVDVEEGHTFTLSDMQLEQLNKWIGDYAEELEGVAA